jgi:hypothetical protein
VNIYSVFRISPKPDQPASQKWALDKEKFQIFHVLKELEILFGGLDASAVA